MTAPNEPSIRLTPIQWLICTIAAIGFAFDIYEILMLPLIVRPALLELTGAVPGSPQFQMWVGRLFYIPAFAGGIFGLIGGYLTDRLGRRRVLTYSILIYAVAAFLSGFSTSIEMLLVLRCFVFIGVCVEFVAAVAWLAELFPEPTASREGARLHAGVFVARRPHGRVRQRVARRRHAASLPALSMFDLAIGESARAMALHAHVGRAARDSVDSDPPVPAGISGVAAEESGRHAQAAEHRRAVRARSAPHDDRHDDHVCVRVRRRVRRDSAGAANRSRPARSATDDARAAAAARGTHQRRKSRRTSPKVQEVGGLAGRVALAYLAVVILSRRKLIRLFQIPGLIVMPLTFAIAGTTSLNWLYVGMFLAGFFTVGQFSFWGNYLPRVYPLYLRGTGESFAANIGGRLIGTSFAWLTATLAVTPNRAYAPTKVAYVAAAVGFSVYLVGIIASFWLPEPPKDNLPD